MKRSKSSNEMVKALVKNGAKYYAENIELKAKCERYEAALNVAKHALDKSYDVLSYPATGDTLQDKAIATINAALSGGRREYRPRHRRRIRGVRKREGGGR